MKWIVRGFLLLITLVFLTLAGLTYLLVTFNPNDYKPQIAEAVTKATGRSFAINGEIKATVFPVLGFEAQGVRMGNPDGFGDDEFLSVGSIKAGVKVEPLLDNKIELTKIVLGEPSINVIKLKDGTSNLTFPARADKTVAEGEAAAGAPAMDFSVEQIEITGARINYDDRAKGQQWIIAPANITLPGFKPGASTPVKVDVTMKQGDQQIRITGGATMNAAGADQTFTLQGLQADIAVKSPALAQEAKISFRGDMTLDQKNQTAEGKDMRLSWQGTDITAAVAVKNFSAPQISFTAAAPTIDLDTLTGAFAKKEKAANDNKDLMPFDMLRALALDGTIKVDRFKMAGLEATALNATIKSTDGLLKIAPVTATAYDGAFNAAITVDARNTIPTLAAEGTLKGLQVGPVLQAKMGQDYLTGEAGLNFDLRATGRSMAALKSAAGGTFGFDFGEGYINKWQLSKLINQAITYFETGNLDPNASDTIRFTSLDGSFTGQNGVFRNDNLVLMAPKSHALGAGTVNLAQNTVDYTVRVGGGDDPAKFDKKTHIPVRISGPLSKPQYAIDVQGMIQGKVEEKIEEKKEELLNKAFEKLSGKKKADPAAVTAPAVPAPETPAVPETAAPATPAAPAVEAPAAPAAQAPAPVEAPAPAAVEAPVEAPAAIPSEAVPDAAPADAPADGATP